MAKQTPIDIVSKKKYDELLLKYRSLEEEVKNQKRSIEDLKKSTDDVIDDSNYSNIKNKIKPSLFETIVNKSQDAIFIYRKSQFLFVNSSLCQITGYTENELINTNIWKLVHPDDINRIKEYAENRTLGEEKVNNYQAKIVTKNGETKHCSFSVRIASYNNKPSVVGQVRDISEELQTQKNIQDELSRLETIFNSVNAYIYVSDIDNYEILFANGKVQKDIGFDYKGVKCWNPIHNNTSDPCEYCNNNKLIDSKGNINKPINWEFFNKRLKKWFLIKDQAIAWPDGRTVRLEVATDITDRKNMLKTISDSNQKFKSIFENAPMGVMYYNNKGIVLDCNDIFVKIIGSSKEVLIGFDMLNQLKDKKLIEQLALSLKTGDGYYEDKYESVTTKKTTPVRLVFKGIKNEKKEIYAGVCIVEDITTIVKSRDEILASNQTFKNIYDFSTVAIYFQDIEGKFIDVNQGAINMYGYTKEEFIGKTPDFLADKSKTNFVKFQDIFSKVLNGEPQFTEFWGKKKDGSTFPKLVRLAKGNYFGKDAVIAFAVDITNIKETEALLSSSEEKYRIITETADELISTITIENDPKYTYVSPSHYRKLGYKSEELIGKSISEIIHPKDYERIYPFFNNNNSKIKNGIINKHPIHLRVLKNDSNKKKEWRSIETNATLEGDEIILISRDITERLEIESERLSNMWLLESLDKAEVALRSDIDIEKTIANVLNTIKSVFKCCGSYLARIDDSFSKCDIKYESFIDDKCNVFDSLGDSVSNFIEQLIRSTEAITVITPNTHIKTTEGATSAKCTKLFLLIRPNEGNPWIFGVCNLNKNHDWTKYEKTLLSELGKRLTDTINIMQNLTNLKTSQEEIQKKSNQLTTINKNLKETVIKAEESDKLKSLFLANMSHEIRTPMNSIIGFSDLMQKSFTSNADRIEYAGIINSSSKMLLALISDIVDISRIEAGELTMFYTKQNLNNLIKELHNQYNINSKNGLSDKVKLKYKTKLEDNNSIIKTDSVRLKQVLTNLITNALKFTKKGEIEFGYEIEDQSTLKFYVRDTGLGIKKEDIKYIFKRFGQAMSTNKAIFGGAGLGLSISEGIVKLLGGKMWVESTYRKGTSVFFTHPLETPLIKEEPTIYSKNNVANPDWSKFNLMVVDDNPATIQFFKAVLKPTNSKLYIATNGEQAIETIKATPSIDLILMDIRLPGMSGLETTAIIKKIKSKLPIIAQTAYALSGDREKAIQGGCDDYIAKPIGRDELLTILNKYLN